MSKPYTNSQTFQALLAAEVAFLKALPQDEEKRKALIIVDRERQKRKIKKSNEEERRYSGPPILTDEDKEEEIKRLDQLSKKFNCESAQRSKVRKDAYILYLRYRAELKKNQNKKVLSMKKVNLQLREEVNNMTQKIQRVQKTLENNIKRYQSINDELTSFIADNTSSLLHPQSSAHIEETIENLQKPTTHIAINQELDIINFPIADPCNNLDDINDLVHTELYGVNSINSNTDDYILDNDNSMVRPTPNEEYDANLLNTGMNNYTLDNSDIIDNIDDLITNNNNNIGTIMLDLNVLFDTMSSDTY